MRRMRWSSWNTHGAIVVLGIAVATVSLAQALPRLPEDYVFPQGEGSPGRVTFSHVTHIDQKKPDCTACHPALFKILEKGSSAQNGAMRHSSMEQGRQCGACHDGRAAFGLDTCELCHRGQ